MSEAKIIAICVCLLLIAVIALWPHPDEAAGSPAEREPQPTPPPQAPSAPARWIAVDGDTIKDAGAAKPKLVRIAGIDAPEIGSKDAREKAMGIAARDHLAQIIAAGSVQIRPASGRDKFGRILAHVHVSGEDVAARMIAEGHARPYDGKGKRQPW